MDNKHVQVLRVTAVGEMQNEPQWDPTAPPTGAARNEKHRQYQDLVWV